MRTNSSLNARMGIDARTGIKEQPTRANLKIMTRQLIDQIVSISIKGTVDNYTYAEVEQVINQLFEQNIYRFLVDLSRVDYISCSGAGVFIGALGVAQENNGNIVLFRPSPSAREVFDLLGLDTVFTITDDMDEAFVALESPQPGLVSSA